MRKQKGCDKARASKRGGGVDFCAWLHEKSWLKAVMQSWGAWTRFTRRDPGQGGCRANRESASKRDGGKFDAGTSRTYMHQQRVVVEDGSPVRKMSRFTEAVTSIHIRRQSRPRLLSASRSCAHTPHNMTLLLPTRPSAPPSPTTSSTKTIGEDHGSMFPVRRGKQAILDMPEIVLDTSGPHRWTRPAKVISCSSRWRSLAGHVLCDLPKTACIHQ